MNKVDFNNKTFSLVENSSDGKASSDTVFKYKQDNDLVTAVYHGGGIKYGTIIAQLHEDKLNMRYQCLTSENELKSGKAIARINFTEKNKIKLRLSWEWLDESSKKGISEYLEN